MRATLLQWCRTSSYLIGAIFFLWLGYLLQNYLIIPDGILKDRFLLVLRESPYLSFSVPIWIANVIAGVLLCGTLLLIKPILPKRWYHFTVFTVLILIVTLPFYLHIKTNRFNPNKLSITSYSLISYSIGTILCFCSLIRIQFIRLQSVSSKLIEHIQNLSLRVFLVVVFGLCLLICTALTWVFFDGVPGFIDSCAYMFQARIFGTW